MKQVNHTQGAEAILFDHRLRKTTSRLGVLSVIASKHIAVPLPAIAGKTKINRATLYNVLHGLESKGVIYKIVGSNGIVHYALNASGDESTNKHSHAHFNCLLCKKIYRLDKPETAGLLLPEGYNAETLKLCVWGTCPSCNKKVSVKSLSYG